MAFYSANKPNKTLTLHKNDCSEIPSRNQNNCGCIETGDNGNHQWFCENHITLETVDQFMGFHNWTTRLCSKCYK